jgi:cytochrome c553
VTLSDGTVVTADDDYLYTSIKEPGAMKRRGAVGIMPSNKLTDQEIASIIAYIRALK